MQLCQLCGTNDPDSRRMETLGHVTSLMLCWSCFCDCRAKRKAVEEARPRNLCQLCGHGTPEPLEQKLLWHRPDDLTIMICPECSAGVAAAYARNERRSWGYQ